MSCLKSEYTNITMLYFDKTRPGLRGKLFRVGGTGSHWHVRISARASPALCSCF
ncbi:MAG TPA: hypothetical protein VNS50_07765 [Ginsengibacter sp.]|nr:hypothetical protein [Ginsengibacter sp.]